MTTTRAGQRPAWLVLVALGVAAGLPGALRAQAPDLSPDSLVGAYRTETGGLFLIGVVSGRGMQVRDMERGPRGVLEKLEEGVYGRDGIRVEVARGDEGEIRGLEVTVAGERRAARRVPMRVEGIAWMSDGARIAGTLLVPAGEGPFPLVVAQPGSSWQTRYNEYGVFPALMLVASGTAALIYDKRGFGESGGERLVSFRQTARDLAAGVDALRSRFDIDPTRVGAFGLSQGGWIAPLAATMTDGIHFLVLVGAAGTSPARQEIQRARAVLRAEGYPPEEVEAIGRFQELAFHYGATGEGWEAYLEARSAAEGKGWLDKVWSPTEPGPDYWLWGRLNGSYNPLAALLELDVPLLAVWGEYDTNVLPDVHRSIFEVVLDYTDHADHTLLVVPGADHTLEIPDPDAWPAGAAPAALMGGTPFKEDAWRRIVQWVQAHTDGPGFSR